MSPEDGRPTPAPAPDPEAGSAPITVNVLTGFLGSGKTLLLKRLLALPDLSRTAVLINEFGEVGIDQMLVETVDEDVVLLQSGCVCCTIRGDLKDSMVALHGRMQRGEVPAFDRLVIETTGLADPAPIVATLTADPVLRYHFRLGNVVTVVDGIDGERTLDTYAEALHQAAVADRLVISKTDLADPARVAALRERLAALNPTAELRLSTETSATPAGLLLDDIHDARAKSAEVERWLAAEATHGVHGQTGGGDHEHDAVDVNRHGDIRAFCLTAEAPLDWAAFGLWLSMLLNRHGGEILRVKGLLNITGIEAPVVVHGVQHTVHKPEHLAAWPDGDTRTRIVVIARGLDPATVERSFRAFNDLGSGQAASTP
ncbi:MAG: GTP-binding protein [Azospirillaceae bacterium]